MKLLLAAVAALVGAAAPAYAQLASPSGVVTAYVEIVGRDVDAQRRFWTALGGEPAKRGAIEGIRFPGGFLKLRQGEPTAGSTGAVVDHVGLHVKSVQEWLPKWQAAGLRIEPTQRPTQLYLLGPDDIRVEVIESAAIDTSVRMHHLHFFVPDPVAVQAWYAKVLGAVPGKRGQFDKVDIGGIELTFGRADMARPGTKGRSLDHIVLEVKDLETFLKTVQGNGVALESPASRTQAAPGLRHAYITDPWGAYLELTEAADLK